MDSRLTRTLIRIAGWSISLLIVSWLYDSYIHAEIACFIGFSRFPIPIAPHRWRCKQCNRYNSRLVQVCDFCHTERT